MKEVIGNLWDIEADARVITTNGYVKKNGHAVMGRGVALQASHRHPLMPATLGSLIKLCGNIPFFMQYEDEFLITLPVKHHWQGSADLNLIESSVLEMVSMVNLKPWKVVVMPRPGCGNGQLNWSNVKPTIEPLLDNRFVIVNLPDA